MLSRLWSNNQNPKQTSTRAMYRTFYSLTTVSGCLSQPLTACMNIKSLIRNCTIKKCFSFYEKHIFNFTTIFCNILHFIFQCFGSTCLICYLIPCYKLVLSSKFNSYAKVYPVSNLITWILSPTSYKYILYYSTLIFFSVNLFENCFDVNLFSYI